MLAGGLIYCFRETAVSNLPDPNSSSIHQYIEDYVTYLVQVLSGNWSPNPKGIYWPFYIVGALTAILLNLLTIAGVTTAGFILFTERSTVMDKIKLFDLRSVDQMSALRDLIDEICDPAIADEIKRVIPKAIENGNKIWRDETLPDYLGFAGAEKFISQLQTSIFSPERPSAITQPDRGRRRTPSGR